MPKQNGVQKNKDSQYVNQEEIDYNDYMENVVAPKKLTGWKKEPQVSDLKADVSEATPDFNTHIGNIKGWLDIRDAKLKIKIPEGQSKVQPKLVRKQNEWRYSALSEPFLSSDDMFDVMPSTHADTKSARDNAIILNKQFRVDIDRVNFIDEYVRTAVDEGTVFVRVGWEFSEEEYTYDKAITELVPSTENPAEWQEMQMAVQSGKASPDILFQEVKTGEFEEITELKTIYNRPTLEVVDYNKIMLDPTCHGNINKANFMVYQFYSNKGELNEDPKYSNIDSIVITEDNPMSYSDDDSVNTSFQFQDETRKRLLVTEYWGKWDIHDDGTTVPIVATYVGKTMIRLEENPFPDKKPPFIKAVYLPKRRDVYGGEPDAVLIKDNQDIVGAVTRGMIDLMGKSANAQQGVSADALDTAQRIKFEQGKDFTFNPGVDPSKAFFMGSYPEIPRSAPEMIQHQEKDAESLTAIQSWSNGMNSGSMGKVAEGIRSANDAGAKRELGILRRLAHGMVQLGEKIVAMNAINLDDEEVIRITDEEQVTISREHLAGQFDLKLTISTPEVDQEQAQDLGFMLQTIGPNMDPKLQGKILGKIARLKKMPELAKDIEEYEPQPNPMDEKIKELQLELLAAQLANEVAKGNENTADTELKYAKAETEKAKARNLHSDADNQDLNFLQENAGTQHDRDMEMEDKRLDGDIGRKAADSLLDKETPSHGARSMDAKPLGKINPSSGSLPVDPLDELDGMNMPVENLADELAPSR